MGIGSWWHWLIVLVVVLLLFGGKGKISSMMGDFGKGLKSFKKNMKEDGEESDAAAETETKRIASEDEDGAGKSDAKDKAANG